MIPPEEKCCFLEPLYFERYVQSGASLIHKLVSRGKMNSEVTKDQLQSALSAAGSTHHEYEVNY
ncbi:MAG: hypothetical protein AAGD96_30620, partial [Chloroflexota bacterium]